MSEVKIKELDKSLIHQANSNSIGSLPPGSRFTRIFERRQHNER